MDTSIRCWRAKSTRRGTWPKTGACRWADSGNDALWTLLPLNYKDVQRTLHVSSVQYFKEHYRSTVTRVKLWTVPYQKLDLPYDKSGYTCECHKAMACCRRDHMKSPQHSTECCCEARVDRDTTSEWGRDTAGTAAHCGTCAAPEYINTQSIQYNTVGKLQSTVVT